MPKRNRRLHIEGNAGIEIFCGPMGCGKTDRLIDAAFRAQEIGKEKVVAFKPRLDTRTTQELVSRTGRRFPATPISDAREILEKVEDTDLVVIDEVQFFGESIVEVVKTLARERQLRVVLGGLDMDFRGEPFGFMPALLAIATKVKKLSAECTFEDEEGKVCGYPATMSQRLIEGKPARWNDPVIMVGKEDLYTARCIYHHIVVRDEVKTKN